MLKIAQDFSKYPSGYVWSLIKCTAQLSQKLTSSLKMSLFFHLNLRPLPSQIIVHLYKPSFWPFQIFIHRADGEPPLHIAVWPPWVLWYQLTAFFDPLMLPFTCQVSHLNMCLASQRIWYEFFALDNGQSSPTIVDSSMSYYSWRGRVTRWPGHVVRSLTVRLC